MRPSRSIVGAAHKSGGVPTGKSNVKGYVRGFDVRTGKRLWIFHTIPSPGEFGNDTWEKDSWSYTGNAGVWGQISIDEELGTALSALPNLPLAEVPDGVDESGNVLHHLFGNRRNYAFTPKPHDEIGAALGFITGDQIAIPDWADRFYLLRRACDDREQRQRA